MTFYKVKIQKLFNIAVISFSALLYFNHTSLVLEIIDLFNFRSYDNACRENLISLAEYCTVYGKHSAKTQLKAASFGGKWIQSVNTAVTNMLIESHRNVWNTFLAATIEVCGVRIIILIRNNAVRRNNSQSLLLN